MRRSLKYGSEAEASRWVATPSTSAHVSGDAVDIGPSGAAAWLSEHGAEYGLCQIYGNESWHYELRPEAIDHGCPAMYADPTHDPRMQRDERVSTEHRCLPNFHIPRSNHEENTAAAGSPCARRSGHFISQIKRTSSRRPIGPSRAWACAIRALLLGCLGGLQNSQDGPGRPPSRSQPPWAAELAVGRRGQCRLSHQPLSSGRRRCSPGCRSRLTSKPASVHRDEGARDVAGRI